MSQRHFCSLFLIGQSSPTPFLVLGIGRRGNALVLRLPIFGTFQTLDFGMSTTICVAKWYSAKHQSFFRSSSGAPFVDHSKILVFDITRINTRACSSQSICWKPTPRQLFFNRYPRDPCHSNISVAYSSSASLPPALFVWKCFMMSRACFTRPLPKLSIGVFAYGSMLFFD